MTDPYCRLTATRRGPAMDDVTTIQVEGVIRTLGTW